MTTKTRTQTHGQKTRRTAVTMLQALEAMLTLSSWYRSFPSNRSAHETLLKAVKAARQQAADEGAK